MNAEQDRSANATTWVDGAVAGFIATIPMTVVMLALYPLLPRGQRYELPPEQITEAVAGRAGAEEASRGPIGEILSGFAHFGFGAAAGAVYPLFAKIAPLPFLPSGFIYGLLVWFGSYQGWIPRARLLPPASRQPAGRNLLMIAAHLAWGSVLAWLLQRRAHSRMQPIRSKLL